MDKGHRACKRWFATDMPCDPRWCLCFHWPPFPYLWNEFGLAGFGSDTWDLGFQKVKKFRKTREAAKENRM